LSKRGGAELKKIAHTDSLTQAEWLEVRRGGIGGSDISTIFNLNEWKSQTYLYMEKRGEITPDDLTDNEPVYWGNQLEDIIRKEFQKRNGWKVYKNNFVLCHDEYDYLRANIDGEVLHPADGRGVLEIKTTNEYNKDEWSGDHVPNAYMLQIQYYMGIMNYGFAYVAVLIGGNKYRQWRIERDDDLINMIFARCHAFWQRVKAGNPPALDGHKSTGDALQKYFPLENEKEGVIELSHDATAAQLLQRHEEIKQELSKLTEEKEAVANELKNKLGDFTQANCHDFVITWKAPKESFSIAAKDLLAAAPDVYEKIKKPKKRSRTFNIKIAK
jgi:putative phage-type endonuclease